MFRSRIVAALAVVTLSSFILGGCFRKKQATAEPAPSPIVQEKFNTIDITERPYLTLVPTNNGRSVTLTLHKMGKSASKGEFEVEYQSGTLLQGFGGRLNLEELPDVQEYLLGSCSAGGKCSYSENVTGGALTLRFTADEKFALKNEWSFLENKQKSDTLTSRDAKFTLQGKGVASVTHWTVLQTPGYPAAVEKPLSLPYAVGALKTPKGDMKVSIRLTEDVTAAQIMGWDGKAWKPLKTTVADRVASAASPTLYESYIAVAAP